MNKFIHFILNFKKKFLTISHTINQHYVEYGKIDRRPKRYNLALHSNIRIYRNCYNKLAPTIVLTKLAIYYDCKVLHEKNSNTVHTLFDKLIHRECILWNLFNKMSCISPCIRSKDYYSDPRIADVLKKFNKDLQYYLDRTKKINSRVRKFRSM